MSYSKPPSRSGAHLSMSTVGSYDRPSAAKVISYHAGTVLEDGLDSRDTVSKQSATGTSKGAFSVSNFSFSSRRLSL